MTRDQKERLLLDLLPYIGAEAARFARRCSIPRDDLQQEATLSAWIAIDRIDETLGYKAWTFLRPRVVGAMTDYARKRGHLLGSTRGRKMPAMGSLVAGGMVLNHRTTPQDDLLAADAFWDLTRGNVLLHRVYQHGQQIKDVAAEYGQPASTVGRRVKRALQHVRQRIEGHK